jgi:hypothetical protein
MLLVDLEASNIEHNIERMEVQSPTTKYASLKESSTILVLGHNPALNQGLVNLFLALDNSKGNAFSVSNKETYSKNGLHIHQLTLSFAASRDASELNDEDAESQPDPRTQELTIDTISTPGILSGEVSAHEDRNESQLNYLDGKRWKAIARPPYARDHRRYLFRT